MKQNKIKNFNNFTLIELLVVVAIIGILLSLLLPSLRNARAVTKSVVCKSNQMNMYKAYIMHCEDGLNVAEYSGPYSLTANQGHKAGQLPHFMNLQKRLKVTMLDLAGVTKMNCPEYEGSSSSYGSNNEDPEAHTAGINQRMFLSEINSTVDFILIGCRNGDKPWHFNNNQEQLAGYHPKSKGNISCADGHVISTTRFALLDTTKAPSLINN